MKRAILVFALALCAIALISAQGNSRWGPGFGPGMPVPHQQRPGFNRNFRPESPMPPAPPVSESIKVSGNLTIAQGMIAVAGGDVTYLVRGLDRYIGFIDDLKEGAAVTLEGYALPHPHNNQYKLLTAQKMTLNGKDYEIGPLFRNRPRPHGGF